MTAGADFKNGALDAAGTSFTDGLLSNVPGVKTVLSGEASPILNGALGNMGGAMFEDGVNDMESPGSISTTQWVEDLVTSGATGLVGSAIGKGIANRGRPAADAGADGDDADDGSGEEGGDGESLAAATTDAGDEGGIELQNLTPIHDGTGDAGSTDSATDNGSDGGEGSDGDSSDGASFHTADDGASDAGSDASSETGSTSDSSDSATYTTAPEPPADPGGYGPGKVTAMSTAANLGVYTVGSVIEGGIQNITGQAQSASQILSSLEKSAAVENQNQNQN